MPRRPLDGTGSDAVRVFFAQVGGRRTLLDCDAQQGGSHGRRRHGCVTSDPCVNGKWIGLLLVIALCVSCGIISPSPSASSPSPSSAFRIRRSRLPAATVEASAVVPEPSFKAATPSATPSATPPYRVELDGPDKSRPGNDHLRVAAGRHQGRLAGGLPDMASRGPNHRGRGCLRRILGENPSARRGQGHPRSGGSGRLRPHLVANDGLWTPRRPAPSTSLCHLRGSPVRTVSRSRAGPIFLQWGIATWALGARRTVQADDDCRGHAAKVRAVRGLWSASRGPDLVALLAYQIENHPI